MHYEPSIFWEIPMAMVSLSQLFVAQTPFLSRDHDIGSRHGTVARALVDAAGAGSGALATCEVLFCPAAQALLGSFAF